MLITGAGGQLGAALHEAFPEADARTSAEFNVVAPPALESAPELVLHAAAWTDVDGAEEREELAAAVNVRGTRNVVELGAPVVYYSTDYVFDGSKREPYVESDEPNPLSAYGRTKLEGEREIRDGWVVRSSWLFGATGKNFVRTMLALGQERDEVRSSTTSSARRPSSATWPRRRASCSSFPTAPGTWPPRECTWFELAGAIFEEAGIECRVVPISTEELGRPAPRPAYSVLRSEREGAPKLPHWREGLRACLERVL